MNENFEPLDERLKSADPAKRFDSMPDSSLVEKATREPNKPSWRWQFQSRLQRLATVGVAAAAATAFVIPSVLGGSGTAPLIQLSAAGGQASQGAAAGAESLSRGQSAGINADQAKIALYPWVQYEYQYTDAGLSAQSGSGHIYQLVPKLPISQIADALRDQLGAKGSLQRGGTPDWPYYFIGSSDPYAPMDEAENAAVWSKPVVTINPAEGSNSIPYFSYNDNSAQPTWNCRGGTGEAGTAGGESGSVVEPKPSDTSVIDPGIVEPCEPVIPADAVPLNQSAAKAKAIALFEALGYQVGTSVKKTDSDYLWLQVQQDEWNLTITGYLVVAGSVVNQSISLQWSVATGKLAWVSGMVAKAKDMGTFDLQSPKQAMARLSDYRWSGDFWADWNSFQWSTATQGGVMLTDDMVRDNSVVATEPAAVPAPDDLSSPMPEPTPTVKVVNIAVSRATPTLLGVWDADQRIWLVPGYLFYDSTGYVGNAFAVADGVLKLPDYSQMPQPMTK